MRITRLPIPPSGPVHCARGSRRLARTLVCAATLGCVLACATGVAEAQPVSVLAVAKDFETVLNNLRNWLVGILALIATVCLTVGGARYLICAGDPSEVERSKTALKAACIGYALAILAPAIVEVLKSIVGG